MPDLTAIPAILASLKNATDIAKFLRTVDASVAQADLKLRSAELVEALADAKVAAVDLRDQIEERDREISRLTEALKLTASVAKFGDAYFEKGEDGQPCGDPFCLHCWESKRTLHHLVYTGGPTRLCPNCKISFNSNSFPMVRGR